MANGIVHSLDQAKEILQNPTNHNQEYLPRAIKYIKDALKKGQLSAGDAEKLLKDK